MARFCLALLALVAVAAAAPAKTPLTFASFEEWKAFHGKTYKNVQEEALRKLVYARNERYVKEHNSGDHSYTLAMNEFADLTNTEFAELYLSKTPMTAEKRSGEPYTPASEALPSSVDWRTKGYVTGVKNQGQCGSCWAFSTTGSLEGQHFAKTGNLVSLSEQNLVDCSGAQGNQGCNGGLMDDAFKYIQSNNGIDTEASYPYTARDGTCKFQASNVGATVTGFKDIQKGSESDLQNAVGTVGPVSVAIDASHPSFQMYHSGVYKPLFCSSENLDHGVLAVGYGTESGKDYWLVKNSWGAAWGEQGYIKMIRNDNNKCGIATAASYPTV